MSGRVLPALFVVPLLVATRTDMCRCVLPTRGAAASPAKAVITAVRRTAVKYVI
jgi:hypothetical protein